VQDKMAVRSKQSPAGANRIADLAAAPALSVRDLSFCYGRRPALQSVAFHIRHGRFTALLGPNGAGKTTLFSLVTRLLEPPADAITILGKNLVVAGSGALAEVGVVFQLPTLDLDLTVVQNLAYFAALHGIDRRAAAERIDHQLESLGLTGMRRARVRMLSGGQRRRIEIARALLHGPQLLLLDEPTVGLDIPTRRAIVDQVHALAAGGVAVLWATHLIDEIRDKDDLIILDRGRVVACGGAQDIVRRTASQSLGEAFDKLISSESEAP
jgi:ABC-2 type transport system ATP-binding protein